ncbi:DCN1-like protein 4 isoform X1 [Limulus polyphemus]|uniref:Defective in cullin neddylation protein n=1 Tax=Limulus polyphemus TaxID=6850 RepID=A0ABM1T3V9_LIMPO|nr:DCN1-like protein 4 isoform X1 [Limulus polyphemus]XP_022250563.1 DCN1-like protein 4 isoform X1 [Limulus polyphemus]XP_022250565.1 DCN1-like protein 4 isoform X1 [Limulus polyphemus]
MPPKRKVRPHFVEEGKHSGVYKFPKMHSSTRRTKNGEVPEQGFSQKKCIALFREYTSIDDPDIIGPDGMEKFCEDIGVEPEDVVMLVLAWKMEAKQMGFFRLSEWLKGLSDLQCDTIQIIQSKLDYLRSLLDDPISFKSIYRYAYDFARVHRIIIQYYLMFLAVCCLTTKLLL